MKGHCVLKHLGVEVEHLEQVLGCQRSVFDIRDINPRSVKCGNYFTCLLFAFKRYAGFFGGGGCFFNHVGVLNVSVFKSVIFFFWLLGFLSCLRSHPHPVVTQLVYSVFL